MIDGVIKNKMKSQTQNARFSKNERLFHEKYSRAFFLRKMRKIFQKWNKKKNELGDILGGMIYLD